MARLTELGDGVFVWLADSPSRGHTNSGLIVDDDALTVVDAQTVPNQSAELLADVEKFGVPVKRVVLTSSHIEFVGGSSSFTMAAFFGSPQTSAHLDQPANVEVYQRLLPSLADEFIDLTTKPVSHMVAEGAYVSGKAIAVPTNGELGQNLVVQVPHANVVFAGAMAPFGVTPNAFDGDPAKWAQSLDDVIGWGATIVPGHGPVGTHEDVVALQAYLWACVEAEGDPTAIPAGPWDQWSGRELDAVNVERAYMLANGDDSPPPSMLAQMGIELQ